MEQRTDVGTAKRRRARRAQDRLNLGTLNSRLGYVLRRAQVAVFQDFQSVFTAAQIRPAQYATLTIIECNPGLSQSEAATAVGIKKTNFVGMLDQLEKRGLVRRAAIVGDRRTYALHLTDAGIQFMRMLHALTAEHEQRIMDQVGAETYAQLFEGLRQLETLASLRD